MNAFWACVERRTGTRYPRTAVWVVAFAVLIAANWLTECLT